MNLIIHKYPHKILKEKTKDINDINGFVKVLSNGMIKLLNNKHGYALTANQVGHSLSMFVLHSDNNEITELMDKYNITSHVIINPVITHTNDIDLIDSNEGCLSIPNEIYKVKRYSKITVSFKDITCRFYNIEIEGLLAIIFQHEIDHLNGICINEK